MTDTEKIVQMIKDQTDLVCYWVQPIECFKKGYKQAIVDGVNLVEYTDNYAVHTITAHR